MKSANVGAGIANYVSRVAYIILDPDGPRRREIARRLSHLGTIRSFADRSAPDLGKTHADMVLAHTDAGDLAGFCREILDKQPNVAVIGYAEVPDVSRIVSAMHAGAHGYLKWPFTEREFRQQVAQWRASGNAADTGGVTTVAAGTLLGLSRRQRQVLQLMTCGKANKEIARLLGIGVRTVETHRASMLLKLGVGNSVDAIRLAFASQGSASNERKDIIAT